MSYLDAIITGVIAGLMVLLPALFAWKKLENLLNIEEILYNVIENASKDEALQSQLYTLGGLLGKGFAQGMNLPKTGGKRNWLDTGLELLAAFKGQQQNGATPSSPAPPTPSLPPFLANRQD